MRSGALAAAAIRGVWGVASGGEDLSHLGPHILASVSQRYDRLVELSVSWYLEGRLPPGGDVELGLVDDAVALVGINPDVPPRDPEPRLRKKLRGFERRRCGSPSDGLTSCGLTGLLTRSPARAGLLHARAKKVLQNAQAPLVACPSRITLRPGMLVQCC